MSFFIEEKRNKTQIILMPASHCRSEALHIHIETKCFVTIVNKDKKVDKSCISIETFSCVCGTTIIYNNTDEKGHHNTVT